MIFKRKLRNDNFLVLKISDGLFLSNFQIAQDLNFLINNKVTLIVNGAPQDFKIPQFQQINIYNFSWFHENNKLIQQLCKDKVYDLTNSIRQTHQKCQSVLICSKRGQSRALTICILYFMTRFHWSLYKSLQFINNRRPDMEVRAIFLKILLDYQNNLRSDSNIQLQDLWTQNSQFNQQLLLTNTYLNSKKTQKSNLSNQSKQFSNKKVKIIAKTEIINEMQLTKRKTSQKLIQSYSSKFKQYISKQWTKDKQSQKRISTYVSNQKQKNPYRNRSNTPPLKKITKTQLSQNKKIQDKKGQNMSQTFNFNISLQIKSLNYFKEKTIINKFNRDKIKVYLTPVRKKLNTSIYNKSNIKSYSFTKDFKQKKIKIQCL